ncbi:hypothetical protein [Streptomyces sp. 891-h]|uniref:hypothetical protein n=1 Tax=Streptomyces sp. 891-h TaxID=2720714 RepID=UPI001FAA7FCC|nr:hypothetical protein [Streptomyces sp. 891-h]UNZ18044.1 hypothetical protein HC362_14245 [Streptomyces sp. 891-h]
MAGTTPGGSIAVLKHLHEYLDHHFRTLHEHRQALQPAAPVFALEHDLNGDDLELLSSAVGGALAEGFDIRHRAQWLPFVVHAAEIGYLYTGDEYWPLFAQKTPGWDCGPQWKINSNRALVKRWFKQFAAKYGGIEPEGAFAANFNIIAWPITHAIMPVDLQRQMAQLLSEARAVMTSEMLDDPNLLGACLATRTGRYSDRFQKLCYNQSLLGHIAAALLSGDDEGSPYLVQSTLVRLVADLTKENESRTWLAQARRSAHSVRSRGFLPKSTTQRTTQRDQPLPTVTNPKLLLRQENGGWHLHLELPDLSALQTENNQVVEELRKRRPKIEGRRQPLPRGALLYPGRTALPAWPRPEIPIIQLEQGLTEVNELIARRCTIAQGPWWVFRKQPGGLATEVKGRFIRPGREYILVGRAGSKPSALPWVTETSVLTDGVHAFDVTTPPVISEAEIIQLATAGLSVVSDVSIQPVGLTPAYWDGEGSVECLAGEPVMLEVRSAQATEKCSVRVNGGIPFLLEWPTGSQQLTFILEDLAVGAHEVHVALLTAGTGTPFTSGSLSVTIRDPHPNLEAATAGTGIRLFATPARPKLTEIWDGRASISVNGPTAVKAQLTIVLRDDNGRELVRHQNGISLPFSDDAWKRLVVQEFRSGKWSRAYNKAESCEVSVSRSGVGFAFLTCERGFHPLRWVLTKQRNGEYEAYLIDRTDGANTEVLLFPVENPLSGEQRDAGRPVVAPANGGMLRATSGNVTAAIILPPDPNRLRQNPSNRPIVHYADNSLPEVQRLIFGHRLWSDADLSADPFSHRQQQLVLDTITTALVSLIAGTRWANLEQKRARLPHAPTGMLDEMEKLVGAATTQRAVARHIASRLWQWVDSPLALREGFKDAIDAISVNSGFDDSRTAAEFLLLLASRPGSLAAWDEAERDMMLRCVMSSPVLIRAARFAVLGTEEIREEPEQPSIRGDQ